MKDVQARNYNLDLLKIISCIAVVGLHTFQRNLSLFNLSVYYLCGFAIPAFFMSSGFVLLNRERLTCKYVLRKIVQIIKVAVFWNVILFFAEFFARLVLHKPKELNFLSLPLKIAGSLLQKGLMYHFWFLGSMILIYLILPLFNGRTKKQKSKVFFVFAAAAVILQMLSFALGENVQKHIIQTFRIWTFLLYFVCGGLIGGETAEKSKHGEYKYKLSFKAHAAVLAVYTVFTAAYQCVAGNFIIRNMPPKGKMYAEYFYDDVFTIIWLIILFTFIMRLKLSEKTICAVKRLSPLIMGVFIVHPLFIKIIKHFVPADFFGGALISIMFFAAVLLLSAISSWILSKLPIFKNMIKL